MNYSHYSNKPDFIFVCDRDEILAQLNFDYAFRLVKRPCLNYCYVPRDSDIHSPLDLLADKTEKELRQIAIDYCRPQSAMETCRDKLRNYDSWKQFIESFEVSWREACEYSDYSFYRERMQDIPIIHKLPIEVLETLAHSQPLYVYYESKQKEIILELDNQYEYDKEEILTKLEKEGVPKGHLEIISTKLPEYI